MQGFRARLALVLLIAAVGSAKPAHSQEWPVRPVKIVVPFAPGGNADSIARIVGQQLGEAFGQPFIIENRPGATGVIAAETVARSPADGYTLLLASLPLIDIVPAMSKTPFDPVRDFVPISAIATNALVLVVNPSLPVRSVSDLISYAREQRGQLSYAAAGVGSVTHLGMVLLLKRAGVEMTAIMYKGGAAMLADTIAGHVKVYVSNVSTLVPYADSNVLRLLAVSSRQRVAALPRVPTLIEAGFPGFEVVNWTGLMAPAGTPRVIVDRIAGEVSRVVRQPKTAALLNASGVNALGNTPDEFAAMIAAEIPQWAEAVKIAGIHEK
jgi:tripartite-type tricarboxylate transporter receptor subunit TctC